MAHAQQEFGLGLVGRLSLGLGDDQRLLDALQTTFGLPIYLEMVFTRIPIQINAQQYVLKKFCMNP